ncbi:MAG: RNA 2',3'-cyclic phosphodiesterase [Bacillota bacterium]|nr:RNA 2',3'-cyclic phosphodiesterase [Bacillota bacterium]
MRPVRCFIAVFLDPALRPQVTTLQRHLAQSGADVKWVEPENLHFTLKFLGDVDESRVSAVGERLRTCVQGARAFDIGLGAPGAFPRVRDPRVIWVGVSSGKEPFVALASTVEEAMKTEGFRSEGKNVSPHLTVGRVRSARNLDILVERLSSSPPLEGSMRVHRVRLMASDLTNRGPVYSEIAAIPLI